MNDEPAAVQKFQKELNAGTVSLVLLAVLAEADEPMYGYRIAKLLGERSGGGPVLKQGTLYPVLRSLEKGGWLASEVEPSIAGPPRRYYGITEGGKETLELWIGAWKSTRDFVDGILEGGSEPSSSNQRGEKK